MLDHLKMGKLLSLTYTRPRWVAPENPRRQSQESSSQQSEGSVRSGHSGSSAGIPDSLAFDNIINGGTCPPMTVRDFMNYLIYVEHSAENLQFYLWYRDYVKRFSNATTPDLALAPEWTQAMEDDTIAKIRKDNVERMRSGQVTTPAAAQIFNGTDFEKSARPEQLHKRPHDNAGGNPFNTPPRTPYSIDQTSVYSGGRTASSVPASFKSQAADAFRTAGVKQPFTIQPFREEINRVIATYIMDGAPRQLNLSSLEQKTAVQALSNTTHPTAFRTVFKSVDSSLRRQAHPNFVRWSICNGNPARVFFARALGVGLIIAGHAVAIVLTLSSAGRGWRALSAIAFVLGISTLVAAYKGMCVVLHGMHHRHVRPWELFTHEDDLSEKEKQLSDSRSSSGSIDGKTSVESFGSSNSYEDEPWVVKYEKRNVVRKVFDREVWIQEPALRQIQDTIFVQAMLAAVLIGGLLTAIFVAVPGGNFF